jgi:hypothetical protein
VGNITIEGGATGQVLSTDGGGALSWITVGTGSLTNGTSNVNVTLNGNVNTSVAGNANVFVVTGTGANVAGTFRATGNANVGNIGAAGGVFTYVTGNGANLTAIAGANVTGTVPLATTSGTVSTAAQPNITSVGTLTSVAVSGTTNLNAVGNVTITGGTNGQVLTTNGSGVLSWSTVAGGLANGTSNVLIPAVNGNVNVTAAGNTTLVVTGTGANIAGTINATGNATVGGSLAVTGDLTLTGRYVASLTSGLNTVVDINCALDNYFKITVGAAQTFSAANVPATGSVYSMTLELITNASAAITWPASVYWPNGTAPTLSTTGKTTLIMMVTNDGGAKWRASSLIDYTT